MAVGVLHRPLPPAAPAPSEERPRWIANATYDGVFFVGSIASAVALTALAIAVPAVAMPATIAGGVLLANTHNLLTGFFFFDRENLAYYRRYPHWYFTVPACLLGLSVATFVVLPVLAFTLHFLFTTWHVVRQSVGIQKLYLGRCRASAFDQRLDATLIYVAVVALHLFAIWKFRPLWAMKALPPTAVHAGGVALTAGVLGVLAVALAGRVLWLGRGGTGIAWARLAFGVTSIGMYAPYLVVDNYQVAFMAGILPHYVQYHGVFWLVGRNKYQREARYAGTMLGALGRNLWTWALLVAVAGMAMALFRAPYYLAEHTPALLATYRVPILATLGLFYGLGWVHFYLDGLFFRFRYPEVRAAILRYLRDPRDP